MGTMKRSEKAMAAIFFLLIVLWAGGRYIGLSETLTAFIGLGLLLLSGVLTWDDVKSEKGAWDTLVWFAILVMMANFLNAKGMISWFSREMGSLVAGDNGVVAMGIWRWCISILITCLPAVRPMSAPCTRPSSASWPAPGHRPPWRLMCWPGSAACSAA
jgi:di/tricarboxylate transporter